MVRQDKFYGWYLVAALFFIICINTAFPYQGAGVLNAAMAKDLALDRKTLGLGFTAMMLVGGFMGPVIAWVLGRLGIRLTLFCGSVIFAAAAILMASWVSQAWQYVAVFGSMLALGVGLCTSLPVQTAVTFWFERRRAMALSIVWAGAGIGGFFAAPLMNKMIAISDGDWRPGWYVIAAAALTTGILALLFVRNRPADLGQAVDGGSVTGNAAGPSKSSRTYRTPESWTVREAFRTSTNWVIILGSIAFSTPTGIVIAHGVLHLKDLGHSPAVAAMGIGLVPLSSVFGKLLSGQIADFIEPRYIWGTGMLMISAGLLFLAHASNPVDIYLFAALIGGGTGFSVVCRSAIIGNYFGPKAFAGIVGTQMPVVTLVTAGAPFLVGVAFDMLGSYTLAFYAVCGLAFTAAVTMLLFAKPPQRNVSQAAAPGDTSPQASLPKAEEAR